MAGQRNQSERRQIEQDVGKPVGFAAAEQTDGERRQQIGQHAQNRSL